MPTRPPKHKPAHGPSRTSPQYYDRNRESASVRGYDRAWQRLRLAHLAAEPLCRFCLEKGVFTPARDVDHIKPICERPDLRLDNSNLRSLCATCHSRHTNTIARAKASLE